MSSSGAGIDRCSGDLYVENVHILNNRFTEDGDKGGGIHIAYMGSQGDTASIINSLFSGNGGDGNYGGGIYLSSSDVNSAAST